MGLRANLTWKPWFSPWIFSGFSCKVSLRPIQWFCWNITIWLVVWNMAVIFPYIGKFKLPTDKVIFFRGVGLNHQPAMICYKHWYTIGPIGFYAEIYDFSSHHRWNLGCRWPASAASRRMPWSTCCGPVTWHRKSGWWFGTWLLFFHNILGIILPNWLSYFSRWLKSPTSIPEKKRFSGNDNWHEWWFIEGSLEVKLPTIWTDEKQSRAEAERRERLEERRVEEKESEERRCRCAKR